ncbi:MAG: hypothetical protein WDO73_21620 [Ignavibacteriota bacterium]
MKCVAILGGGPAGAFAAAQLSSAGLAVQLFDEKLAWEKPCGGGLTYKAYSQYPFLLDNPTAKREVRETMLAAPNAGEVSLKLDEPLLIYSRFDLNRLLLERADRAGAQIEKARVQSITRGVSRWQIRTNSGTAEADFCIVATGARNPLRDQGTQLRAEDTMSALGYYVPGNQTRIDIQFLPHLEGYIWVFPRCGHLSVGICGKGEAAGSLRRRLELYMSQHGISWKDATFYSHLLPSLDASSWRGNRVAGRRLDGGGRRSRPGGSDYRRRSLLRDTLRRPGRPHHHRGCRRARRTACRVPHAPAQRFHGRPGVRFPPREARLPGTLPAWLGPRPDGAVHAPQPPLRDHHPGSLRRQTALPRSEETIAPQFERQSL